MKNNITVSICCTTFNHGKYIRHCLNGFIKQQCDFNFEILIHDDASVDETQDIIREYEYKYPKIIKPIYQTENQYSKGIKINSTFNFSRAKGKYIAICEGDDYWADPLKLQKQVKMLDANPKYSLSFHDVNVVDSNGELISTYKLPLGHRKDLTSKEMCGIITIPTLSIVFRNKENLFKFGMIKVLNGDKVIITYLSEIGMAKFHGDITEAYYRKHDAGIWSGISKGKQAINNYLTFKKLSEFPFKHQKVLRKNALIYLKKIKTFDRQFYKKEIRNFSIIERFILDIKITILRFTS